MTDIKLKRIQDPADPADGTRVLVDGMWPRGIRKADARLDRWLREIAPSAELRRWFGHDPDRWEAFQARYRAELRQHRAALDELTRLARQGPLTLLFSARDREHNQAQVLRRVVQERLECGN